jgi:hypothetical protein
MNREGSIRAIHAALTSETLEALSNKGLMRRAQKDLERGEVESVAISDAGLTVSLSGQRVTLVEAGPAKATCTCPASGVCQHILAACLHLMQQSPSASTDSPSSLQTQLAHDEWLRFSDEELTSHFGLPDLRAAFELLGTHAAEIVLGGAFFVRFPSLNAEVRAVPGAGLAGLIVRGPTEKKHPQYAAAALLAVRAKSGHQWQPPPSRSATASITAPVHRDALLRAVADTLEEMIRTGLARLSPTIAERLDALSISAQTADLHRLNLLLQRLASDTRDWLHRRPHADLGLIFESVATAYALTHGLMTRAQPHLTGVSRESYAEVGALDLVGVTAWPWRTQSGYEGLTLLLWDQANRAWATWSDARPLAFQGNAGFSATARFTQPGPWEGAESPAQLSRSRFRLIKARRNRWNRLSSSTQTRALVTGPTSVEDISSPAIQDWSQLDQLLEQASPAGLRERDPRAAFHVVQPAHWERRPFDPVSQSLSWFLHDSTGRLIELHLPFDEPARRAIERLEIMSPAELTGCRVVGRCQRWNRGLRLFPLALLTPGRIVGLFFDQQSATKQSAASQIASPAPIEDDAEEPDDTATEVPASALGDIIFAATSALEWIAETGLQGRATEARSRLKELGHSLSLLGARQLSDLTTSLSDTHEASALLRLRWMLAVSLRSIA